MRGHTRQRRKMSPPRTTSRRSNGQQLAPGGLLVVCGLFYGAIGFILASFPIAPWCWGLAIVATLLQVIALAGPKALQRFNWWSANLVALVSIMGTGGLTVALSIALNHLGTDQLDDLTLGGAAIQILLFSLLAVVLAALTAWLTALLGDLLLKRNQPRIASLILAAVCLISLGVGAALGSVAG
jgi:hypothetical protein